VKNNDIYTYKNLIEIFKLLYEFNQKKNIIIFLLYFIYQSVNLFDNIIKNNIEKLSFMLSNIKQILNIVFSIKSRSVKKRKSIKI
jgi:hypothetical protein